jgi:DNA polymerase-1
MAMIAVNRFLKDGGFKTRMILQIHDELLFEAPYAESSHISQEIKSIMEQVVELSVPVKTNVSVSKTNWYKML